MSLNSHIYITPAQVLTRQALPFFASEHYPCKQVQLKPQQMAPLRSDLSTGPGGLSVLPLLNWNKASGNGLASPPFKDAWKEVFGGDKLGYTFSNVFDRSKLWDDNTPCRPDRVLFRPGNSSEVGLVALSADVLGPAEGLFESLNTTVQLSDHLGVVVHFGVAKASQDTLRVLDDKLSHIRPRLPNGIKAGDKRWKKIEEQIDKKVREELAGLLSLSET